MITDIEQLAEVKELIAIFQEKYDDAIRAGLPFDEVKPIYIELKDLKQRLKVIRMRLRN